MKKLKMILLLTLLVVVFAAFGATGLAFAAVNQEECDAVFRDTTDKLLEREGYPTSAVSAQKALIYDVNLEELGLVYDFTVGAKPGYAIIINTTGVFEVTELYLDAQNPYRNTQGLPVYFRMFGYASYADGAFCTTEGAPIAEDALAELTEKAYCSLASNEISVEHVYYTHRQQIGKDLALTFPSYTVSDRDSGCAPNAGGNLIAYFDRFAPNLIPNYTPGYSIPPGYIYNPVNDTIDNMMYQIYDDMETTATGTTVLKFKTGMSKYCARYGYDISFSDCMQNGTLPMSVAKQRIDANQPLVVFMTPGYYTLFGNLTGYDALHIYQTNAGHTMAVFGYQEVTYTLQNNSTRTDTYLSVVTGISSHMGGYLNTKYFSYIDTAYAVSVF